jgi:hypothetical protein
VTAGRCLEHLSDTGSHGMCRSSGILVEPPIGIEPMTARLQGASMAITLVRASPQNRG